MPEKMSDSKSKLKKPRLSSEASYSSSSSSSLSSSSDEETDAKDLKPIKEYLEDRKELASQLFKSVKAEKIRMMLPQILRKMDLNDLEELCTSELIGMSKKRITYIIDDKEMLESSETDESDDSGPSLEIISDTEWISDDGVNIKIEGTKSKAKKNDKKSKKTQKKSQIQKNQDSKSKVKLKGKIKTETDGKSNVKVKTEKIKIEGKPKEKEKEGESILDLLELEMRARAIRALIRKEEGTSDKKLTAKTNSESGTSSDQITKTRQANLKEQLEKIQIDNVLLKHGDDEDVFVVIKPAPTIELLSSDSENEDHSKRVNKKLVSERKSENENVQETEQTNKIKDASPSTSKEQGVNNAVAGTVKEKELEISSKKNENQKESSNLPMSVTESIADDKQEQSNNPPEDLEDGEIVDDEENEFNSKEAKDSTTGDVELKKRIKKFKKNPHIRSRQRSKDSDADSDPKAESINEKSKENKSKTKTIETEAIEIEDSPKRDNDMNKISHTDKITSIDLDDDKALDIEEIINLDDYPDDMDIIEKNDSNEDQSENDEKTNSSVKETDKAATSSSRSETWASRYVKQDDVQNVIKESKIQSEIRKRLREKQRQNKIINSPKSKDEELSQTTPEVVVPKPTGSVEEYFALKGVTMEKNVNILKDSTTNTVFLKSVKQFELQLSGSTVINKESPSTSSFTITNIAKVPENIDADNTEAMKVDNKKENEYIQQNVLSVIEKNVISEQETNTANTNESIREESYVNN